MRDIKQLHPELQQKIALLKLLCKGEGLELGIGECLRTVEEQDELYSQGRTKPGNIVTYAPGNSYSSQHQWGIAFDFFKDVPGHAYDDLGFFRQVGELAKSIGLAWGGDWDGFVDRPHVYLPYWGDTPAALIREYGVPENFFVSWEPEEKLQVDGFFGVKTVTRLQEIFGIMADGIISDQWEFYRDENPGLVSVEWVPMPSEGSMLVRRLQEMAGATVDGVIGPETITALQRHFETPEDGCISAPSALVMAIQEWANESP